MFFRTLALPSSDRIFVERSAKSVTRLSGKVASALSQRAQILQQFPSLLRGIKTLAYHPHEDTKLGGVSVRRLPIIWDYLYLVLVATILLVSLMVQAYYSVYITPEDLSSM